LLIFGIFLEKHFTSVYAIVANIMGALVLLTAIHIYSEDFLAILGVTILGLAVLFYGVWKLKNNKAIPFIFGSKMLGSIGLYVALHQMGFIQTAEARVIGFFAILGASYLLCGIAIKKKWRLLSKPA
jgi:hypothetical protein